MRITTKKIRVISMTKEEIQKFYILMQKAQEGHKSHYAEERMDDGSFLGVEVVDSPQRADA